MYFQVWLPEAVSRSCLGADGREPIHHDVGRCNYDTSQRDSADHLIRVR